MRDCQAAFDCTRLSQRGMPFVNRLGAGSQSALWPFRLNREGVNQPKRTTAGPVLIGAAQQLGWQSKAPRVDLVYRPGFSGHKMLLCGRPYWGECGEPFAPGLRRAA